MADVVPHDILENILLRLNVVDLIRCKSVCKSWQSFISHPSFVNTHLNHSYNNDRNNTKIYHRRIRMPTLLSCFNYVSKYGEEPPYCYLVGSSNGLICTCSSDAEIIVSNPCTREMRKLPHDFGSFCWSMCCGFGYDSVADDYKFVVGLPKGDHTLFKVLSLKSNVWKGIGEVKYRFFVQWGFEDMSNGDAVGYRGVGIFCNGALHWVMYPQNHIKKMKKMKAVILSFDLSKENFKEIPQPDDDRLYKNLRVGFLKYGRRGWQTNMCLGTMEDSLCVFYYTSYRLEVMREWIMKNYNVKESWEYIRKSPEDKLKFEAVHYFPMENDISLKDSFTDISYESLDRRYVCSVPIFVRSLVSPRMHQEEQSKVGSDCIRGLMLTQFENK